MKASQHPPINVLVSVGPARGMQCVIPGWKNPIVNAAIDHDMLAASGIRGYNILVNAKPATIYTELAEGDLIELVPTGG